MNQTIPVVDLSDFVSADARRADQFIADFGQALEEFGFAAVASHGVPNAVLNEAYQNVECFFALPDATKLRYEHRSSGRQRGYTPKGKEKARGISVGDVKEFWHTGPSDAENMPSNIWPAEIPAFRESQQQLWTALSDCASLLLQALAQYLGAESAYFEEMIRGGNTVLRSIRYPGPDEVTPEPGAVWAAAHEDINLITLLVEATEPGLEIQRRDGSWLPITPVPGQMIVDTGDMMQRLTNGRIPATTHRVLAPPSATGPRFSIPFFVHPHPDFLISPLSSCKASTDEGLAPITARSYLAERLRENNVLTVDIAVDELD